MPEDIPLADKQSFSTSLTQAENGPPNYPPKMTLFIVALLGALAAVGVSQVLQVPLINSNGLTFNSISHSTRLYWMKQANQALFNYSGPWYFASLWANASPFAAFGTVIVNHTAGGNELICAGANNRTLSGGISCVCFLRSDPTQHGEINAIQNCVRVLTDRGLSPATVQAAFEQLSLYTVSPLSVV
jgi:hypothetical protein